MNTQNIPQPLDPSQQQQQQLIQHLKHSIQLSHHQIHQLLLNQQAFIQKITLLNNTAKLKINLKRQLQISQALVYLNQAEKILQYAAGSGKNINRELIIAVLHNQACVYQILWELQHCSNYLQALIFNYQTFFKQTTQFSLPPSCINLGSQINLQGQKVFGFPGASQIQYVSKMKDPKTITKAQLKLLIYYFQHCAVKSQRQQNKKALQSAKKGIKVLKNAFYEQKPKLLEEMSTHKSYLSQAPQARYFLLQELSQMTQKIRIDKQSIKAVTKSAHFSLQIWSNNKIFNSELQMQEDSMSILKQKLRNLAIGTIMQILPNAYDKIRCQAIQQDPQESILSIQEYIVRVFFLSVGYFSVATQLRILSSTLYKSKKEQDRKSSDEFKQSMVYHLIAIIIASLYIPYECRYITDILASYSKHYSCNLEEYKPIEKESFEKIIQLLGLRQKLQDNLIKSQKENNQIHQNTKESKEKLENKPEINEYNLNCKNPSLVIKSKNLKKKCKELHHSKQYSEQYSNENNEKLKTSRTELKSSHKKKLRSQSKTSRTKRTMSKQSNHINQKIQKKYIQMQKVISNQHFVSEQYPKSPNKKLKSDKNIQKLKEKEKSHTQFSKDSIKVKKPTDKDKLKEKEKDKEQIRKSHAKTQTREKVQRNTKKSQKKQDQKQQNKPNTITQEDQHFFFYMTKKTTKTTNNNGMFSPKQSIKSIGNLRKSSNKKSRIHSSRSNSKSSQRGFGQSPVGGMTMNSPISPRGLNGMKKVLGDKKGVVSKQGVQMERNYY